MRTNRKRPFPGVGFSHSVLSRDSPGLDLQTCPRCRAAVGGIDAVRKAGEPNAGASVTRSKQTPLLLSGDEAHGWRQVPPAISLRNLEVEVDACTKLCVR